MTVSDAGDRQVAEQITHLRRNASAASFADFTIEPEVGFPHRWRGVKRHDAEL